MANALCSTIATAFRSTLARVLANVLALGVTGASYMAVSAQNCTSKPLWVGCAKGSANRCTRTGGGKCVPKGAKKIVQYVFNGYWSCSLNQANKSISCNATKPPTISSLCVASFKGCKLNASMTNCVGTGLKTAASVRCVQTFACKRG